MTIQYFPNLQDKGTLEEFENMNKVGIEKICPEIKWKTISSNENERIWEWNIKGCKAQPDQSEIARLVKTASGFHIFHYAVKKPTITAADRDLWVKNLQAIKIQQK